MTFSISTRISLGSPVSQRCLICSETRSRESRSFACKLRDGRRYSVRRAHLAGFEEVKANVGVARGGIHAVVAEVLADVFRRGLGQQPVNALPETGQ